MTSLYEKYHLFLEDQISYQRHIQEKFGKESPRLALEAKHRELTYREMIEDHRKASLNAKGPIPKQFENFNGPPHREMIREFLKRHGGSQTLDHIVHYGKENGQNQSSFKQMIMQMVRRGELARCGNTIQLPGDRQT